MTRHSIFTRFLKWLGVPHTAEYSDDAFRRMTFRSLYGLSHLLTEYRVKNRALRLDDKQEITRLKTPFLAQTKGGIFVIVTQIGPNEVTYDSLGEMERVSLADFLAAFNGIVLLAFPDAASSEPDYGSHRVKEIVTNLARYGLVGTGVAIFVYFFVTRHLFAHFSTIMLTLFNCAGLYFTWLLVQKSLNIHTAASDRVCGVLEQGGCDSIIKLKVSKLFGVFAWSEIGFGYFLISLLTLLTTPYMLPALAICNLCCLPYTVWSIWYQKFKARHWCTLCVGVQTTLWCCFFCYLLGDWFAAPGFSLVMLIVIYAFTVLGLNRLLNFLQKMPCNES